MLEDFYSDRVLFAETATFMDSLKKLAKGFSTLHQGLTISLILSNAQMIIARSLERSEKQVGNCLSL